MTQPTTILTVDGQVVLTTEAGSVILTHDEAKLLAGRLSMDLSALKVRQQRGEYPFWVAQREAYTAAKPEKRYYVSTRNQALVGAGEHYLFDGAVEYLERLKAAGLEPRDGTEYVVREVGTDRISAE